MQDEKKSAGVDPKTLAGGKILRYLVEQFNNERSQRHLMAVLGCLRDSFIWIPGTMMFIEADAEKVKNLKEDETFSFSKRPEFVPDILRNGDDLFFPVFSNTEQMGEYGKHFSKVEEHFFVAMREAMKQEDVCGIVLDAFTTPFVIPKDFFEIIEKLSSMLKNSNDGEKPQQ